MEGGIKSVASHFRAVPEAAVSGFFAGRPAKRKVSSDPNWRDTFCQAS
jgi:hypothetical protein